MRAFTLHRYGAGVPLQLVDLATPQVGAHDVLVEVHAAGVNLLDSKLRAGEFKLLLPYSLPLTLGHDLAGLVVAVGAEVRRFAPGDAVYGRARDHRIGSFAEQISVHEDDLALKPVNLSMVEAASLPLVALTAWQALVERGRLTRGQRVFIQAGAGGVGTIAIQLAKHLGASVATTASAAGTAMVQGLGADLIVDYQREDFEARLHGYDLVLHSQDDKTLQKSLRVLRPGGQLVSISGPPDPAFAHEIGASWLLRLILSLLSWATRRRARGLGVLFSFLFMKASGDQLRQIAALVEAGVIRPVVDRVFPFAETNAALSYVEAGRAKGKVVIQVQ